MEHSSPFISLPPEGSASYALARPKGTGATAPATFQDRDSIRSKTFLKAYIRFQNRTMNCVVRNMSLSGARVEVSQTSTLPTEFELDILQRGTLVPCALKWRKDEGVGVKFLDAIDPAPSARVVTELRHENARLREGIVRLEARVQELAGES
jgi:hypothetical protein